jgi:Flp pilus assembly pilin Flp
MKMRGLRSRAGMATKPNWLSDERGAVFAEYVVVFLLVTVLVGITVASVGLPLLSLFIYAETLIGLPIP